MKATIKNLVTGYVEYMVDSKIIEKAKKNWAISPIKGATWIWWSPSYEKRFCKLLGITDAQWAEYEESWTLRVSKPTYRKLLLMASSEDRTHWPTLFKAIDAKYGIEK